MTTQIPSEELERRFEKYWNETGLRVFGHKEKSEIKRLWMDGWRRRDAICNRPMTDKPVTAERETVLLDDCNEIRHRAMAFLENKGKVKSAEPRVSWGDIAGWIAYFAIEDTELHRLRKELEDMTLDRDCCKITMEAHRKAQAKAMAEAEELSKELEHFSKQNLEWANCAEKWKVRAETAEAALLGSRVGQGVPMLVGGDFEVVDPRKFPHPNCCSDCRQDERCNYCGEEDCSPATGACTNGRCAKCCAQHCTHVTQ
jgi:hypothetical protein